MKAVIYEAFGVQPELKNVPDPNPEADGVVVKVMATGVCRSDWHGWVGHDPDIQPPHVPGHELAGGVAAGGQKGAKWGNGRRGNGAVRRRLWRLPSVLIGESPGLRLPISTRFHTLGIFCRICVHPSR